MRSERWIVPVLGFAAVLSLAVGVAPAADPATAPAAAAAPAAAPAPASAPADNKKLPELIKAQAKEITLDLGGGVSMKMVLVPAGKFSMGSPDSEPSRRPNELQHEVTLTSPLYLGVCEVTRGQFAAFAKDSGYKTEAEKAGSTRVMSEFGWEDGEGMSWKKVNFEQTDEHPVVCVSWTDAEAFCKWLGGKVGSTVRLPTEAEWEYACRAGSDAAYPWGPKPQDGKGWLNAADLTGQRRLTQWSDVFPWEDGFVFTAPVGSFKPNAFGLYDMQGNVCEWVLDLYSPYAQGPASDPVGPAKGLLHVLRRGGWPDGPGGSRAALRDSAPARTNLSSLGFRVALQLKELPKPQSQPAATAGAQDDGGF